MMMFFFFHKCHQALSSPCSLRREPGTEASWGCGGEMALTSTMNGPLTRLPPSILMSSIYSKTGGRNQLEANMDAEFPARIIIIMNRDSVQFHENCWAFTWL